MRWDAVCWHAALLLFACPAEPGLPSRETLSGSKRGGAIHALSKPQVEKGSGSTSSLPGGLVLLCRCSGCGSGCWEPHSKSKVLRALPVSHFTQRCWLRVGLELVAFRWEAPRRHLNTIHVTDTALSHSPRKQQ